MSVWQFVLALVWHKLVVSHFQAEVKKKKKKRTLAAQSEAFNGNDNKASRWAHTDADQLSPRAGGVSQSVAAVRVHNFS